MRWLGEGASSRRGGGTGPARRAERTRPPGGQRRPARARSRRPEAPGRMVSFRRAVMPFPLGAALLRIVPRAPAPAPARSRAPGWRPLCESGVGGVIRVCYMY